VIPIFRKSLHVRPRHLLPLAATLVATGLSVAPAQAAPLPGVSATSLDAGPTAVSKDLVEAKGLGARVVRLELPWSWLEPEAAGQRDAARLAQTDASMARARSLGLKVALLLDKTPCWTTTAPAGAKDCSGAGSTSRYPPADTAAYASLAAFVAKRYESSLSAIEIWNEPDQSNERYWAGPDKVERYVALLKPAYTAVKAATRRVPVLGGAFVGTDGRWLRAMYAQGAKGYYDGLSVHFYDLGLYGLRRTRAVMRARGDKAPLWLMEAGWNSCKPRKLGQEGQPCVTAATQARDLRNLYAQVRHTSWLRAVIVYRLRDEAADKFGLITTAGKHKPSYVTLRKAFKRGPGRASAITFRVSTRGGKLRVRGSGPDGDAFRLTVRQRGFLRYQADFRMDADNRFSFVLPPQLGTRGLQLRVVQPWSGRAISRRT
jgi:Cellulase (glycosyl hydrolase family 5)